ncbi:MAG: FAD:protein FMN transferase [Oscillospiraceae bacterium]|nr:FAD:protein FMN transferase [Oscillospiraceae bacterium]
MRVILFILCVVVVTVGCSPNIAVVERSAFAMDTLATIKVYGNFFDTKVAESAIDAAFEKLYELDKMLDYNNPDSELSRINSAAYANPVEISAAMSELIETGLFLSELTNGEFDISLGSLIDLWNREHSPSQNEIDELLPSLGYMNILVSVNERGVKTVRFTENSLKLHFGSIAKGYAIDEMMRILRFKGINSAIIEIGGEIGVIGESPRLGNDTGLWKIGVRDPFNSNEMIEILTINRGTVATSGFYERGEHIFEPATGYPAGSEFASVTIISDRGAVSDALSTAVFIRGWEVLESVSWYEEEGWYCGVGVTKEGEVIYSHLDDCHFCVGNNRNGGTNLD